MVRAAAVTVFSILAFGCNCSNDITLHDDGGSTGGGTGHNDGGSGGSGGGAHVDAGPTVYGDFGAAPVLVGDAGIVLQTVFTFAGASDGGADGGAFAGPCLTEPQNGSLFPQDWLRPRFAFSSPGAEGFELKVTAKNQANPLVVYTADPTWTMPKAMWQGLTVHDVDEDIAVEVRSLQQGSVSAKTATTFRIAPASASGAIVYWTTSNGTALKGFHVGDESVQTVLVPTQVPGSACIGCHTSTPDGRFVGFSSSNTAGNGDPAVIQIISVDGGASALPFLTPSAIALLNRMPQQAPAFSGGHWDGGDHVALSSLNLGTGYDMVWTDLEAASTDEGTGWGHVTRSGDLGSPASAVFSHDGKTIAYVSSPNAVGSGVIVTGQADLYTVPFNDRLGGNATPVPGASDMTWDEFYPSYSPDDALLAFTRTPTPETSYDNAHAEVLVVPAAGAATPHRIAGNDPPACAMTTSPGLTNSWPKWGPVKTVVGTKTYYWMTFSSKRIGGAPQLFVAPVVLEAGVLTSYPALYLWNQPANEANHTPAWDLFQIAPEIN